MTVSEAPEVKPKLPGFFSLLQSTMDFLKKPPHASVLFGYAAWLLIPLLVSILGQSLTERGILSVTLGSALDLLCGIIIFALSLWATAAIIIMVTGIVRPDLAPKDPATSVSELAWRRAPLLLWVGLLSGLIQIFGLLLFIVPGIIFSVWLVFAEEEAVLTGDGVIQSLEQSRERVRGYFFPVLGRIISFTIFLACLIALVTIPAVAVAGISNLAEALLTPPVWFDGLLSAIQILLLPLALAFELHLYFALRPKVG